jgi:selenocysteine lyase/cysteine desulfurase
MFLDGLATLHHPDGRAAVRVYGPSGMIDRGGTVAFNLLNRFGAVVPYWRVENRARDAGLALRGGCFCNPGAAEAALELPAKRTSNCLASLGETFTPERFSDCLGSAVGALRVSFGLATSEHDIERAVELLAEQTARD